MPAESVVVFEPTASGHHLRYAALICERATREGVAARLLTTADALASEEFSIFFPAPNEPRVIAGRIPLKTYRFISGLIAMMRLRKECRSDGSSAVVLDGDHVVLPWALANLVRPVPAAFLIMRPLATSSGRRRHARQLRDKSGRLIGRKLSILDLKEPWAPAGKSAVPDPIATRDDFLLTRTAARANIGIDPDRRVVGIVGTLSERKSLSLMLNLFESSNKRPNFELVLAGKPTDPCLTERLFITQPAGVHLKLQFLSEIEYVTTLRALDACLLYYTNDVGSSGILGDCIMLGVPVIGSGNPVVEAAITNLGIGILGTPESTAQSLIALHDSERAVKQALVDAQQIIRTSQDAFAERLIEAALDD